MKIKKYILPMLGIFFLGSAFAQRMQAKFQLGYGVPFGNTPQLALVANNNITVESFSFGSGLRVEGGLVKPLTKSMSVQLDVAYLSGKKNSLPQVSGTSFSNAIYYSKFYDVSPMIRFTAGESKVKPYVAVGPIFGFGKLYRDLESGTSGSSNVVTSTREFKGSFAFGSKSELGVQLQRGKFNYYAQLSVITMKYAPTSSELTSYVVYSSNQLSSLTVAQKQTVYLNTAPANPTNNANQPTQTLKSSYAFDNVNFSIGVMFTL